MSTISFSIGCRNCLQADSEQHVYLLDSSKVNDYINKTEYEVMTKIETWRKMDHKTCNYCGSESIEIMEIQVDDYPLYDFHNLVERSKLTEEEMIIFNIDKSGPKIELTLGGSNKINKSFFRAGLSKIINTINLQSDSNFIPHSKGNFLICITGTYIIINNSYSFHLQIERFRHQGLLKKEILDTIKQYVDQL